MFAIGLKNCFAIRKLKNTVPWTYSNSDLKGKEFAGKFYEKELQKANQEEFRVGKLIRMKSKKLYIKWKGHDSINGLIKKTA